MSLQLYHTLIHLDVFTAVPHIHTSSCSCTTQSYIFTSLQMHYTFMHLYVFTSDTGHAYIFMSLQLHHTFIHLHVFTSALHIHAYLWLYSCTTHPYIFTSLQLHHSGSRSANNYHVKCTQRTCSLLFHVKVPCQFLLHWACAGLAHARCQ